jgi:hypothetical protein
LRYEQTPVVAVQNHLVRIELAVKPTAYLCVCVASETQDGQISLGRMTRLLVYVVDLHRLPR